MGRKNRSHNNNVKRERFAVKELARLKKCLGMVDETGKDILEKVADISTITDIKSIKQKAKEADLQDALDADMANSDEEGEGFTVGKDLVVKNEKTGVTHIYDGKTKKDQFGNFPIWYNRNAEKKKKRIRSRQNPKRGKKRMSLFNVSNPKDYK